MGAACCKRKQRDGMIDNLIQSQMSLAQQNNTDGITIDKSNFIQFKEDEKFKDNYSLGESMGCSTYGEVRKCKNIRTHTIRAVKILKKDRLD